MTRKLLPYEYELIATLGISKEDYLEFLAIQAEYSDPKQESIFDIRNDPGTVVAIVLAVVGVVFQVVSALMTPRPQVPEIRGVSATSDGGERQTREQRFSPRFGFNSVQELAKYGDPVPLVYTNTAVNNSGGVRVTGAMIWSAVRSYGSNQFLQMLMMLTGGAITAIDASKSAFGQTPISDLIAQNKWIYFQPTGTGVLRFRDETSNNYETDPTKYGGANDNPYRLQPAILNERLDGFSQAYSPTSSNTFGGYSPVPLNVLSYLRNEAGDKYSTNLGIYVSTSFNWADSGLVPIAVGSTMRVTVSSTADSPDGVAFSDDLLRSAIDARRTLASVFDDAGIFKLGSARFRVTGTTGTSTDEGDFHVDLTCIEAGSAPALPYNYDEVSDTYNDYTRDPRYYGSLAKVNELLDIDQRGDIQTAEDLLRSPALYSVSYHEGSNCYNYWEASERGMRDGDGNMNPGWSSYADGDNYYFCQHYSYTTTDFIRDLTPDEILSVQTYVNLRNSGSRGSDKLYYLKALVRIEEASYSTLTQCNIVDIALRCQVFRRISGRQREYGRERRGGYASSDNGLHQRSSLFTVRYRVANGAWNYVPGIFVVRRAADQDNYVYLKFSGGATAYNWQFRFEPVADPISEITERPDLRLSDGRVRYYYLQNSGDASIIDLGNDRQIYFTGFYRDAAADETYQMPPINESPTATNEWDWFSLDADTQYTTSFDRGPEFSITAVTEQQRETFNLTRLYRNLSLIGFNVFSGKSLQDMRSFTTFVTQGKPVRRLNTSTLAYPSTPDGPSCFAPDIFLDTVIDSDDGIGNYADLQGIDVEQLAITKRFCQYNNLFFDGVIADRTNWRSFWVSAAPFSLLEFARIGGRETLIPAVPYNTTTGEMTRTVAITALFNQGNILADSYKEEFMDYDANVQDIVATVVYRSLDTNGIFAVNRSLSVQLADTVENDAIQQSFDLSAYVTTEAQAIMFGKLVCNLRRHVRSSIEFKTFPTDSPVMPGAYIYVDIGQNAWNGIYTGTITAGGVLNTPIEGTIPNGTYNILLYRSGNDVVSTTAVITNNAAPTLADREGWLFVLGQTVRSKRVYRVGEVTMDEEGEVTIRATIYPCDTSDRSLIADFSDNLFTIRR